MALLETLSDDFNDNSLDTAKWTGSNLYAETNGQIQLTSPVNSSDAPDIQSVNQYSLIGSYGYIKVVYAGEQTISSFYLYPLILSVDFSNNIWWEIQGNTIRASYQVAGVETVLASTTYDSTAHIYLKIREASGTTYWDYSSDGATWTNFASVANPITLTALTLTIQAWKSTASGNSTTARLDNFNTLDYGAASSAIDRKRFSAKAYDTSGAFVGEWNDLATEFSYSQDINTAGPAIQVELSRSADRTTPTIDTLVAEDGTAINTESAIGIVAATSSADQVGAGTTVELNYRIDIYAFFGSSSTWETQAGIPITTEAGGSLEFEVGSPNGRKVFSGFVIHYATRYGDKDTTLVKLQSYGAQLDNYVIESAGSTTVAFNSYDPSDTLRSLLTSFQAAGGRGGYSSTSVDTTGTVTSYTFKLNTYYEGIKKLIELAPANWFWYYDSAQDLVWFKPRPTTVTHTFELGTHINDISIERHIEELVNDVRFLGGEVTAGAGDNVYRKYTDATSITTYGVGLKRITDDRVKLYDTADILSQSELDQYKNPRYRAVLTIQDGTYIIEDIRLGELVALRNFDNYIDGLTMQIVGLDYNPDQVRLQLDSLLPRVDKRVEDIKRNLEQVSTQNAPSTPS